MAPEPAPHVTELLQAAQAGEPGAAEQLLAAVYEELHRLARARMAHLPPGQTLQPTALVHEAYLRLAGRNDLTWESRRHFFIAAARDDPPRPNLTEQTVTEMEGDASPSRAGKGSRPPVGEGFKERLIARPVPAYATAPHAGRRK